MILSDAEHLDVEADQRERALEDLVERLMYGQEYPAHPTRRQISALDILTEQEPSELAGLLVRCLQPWSDTCAVADYVSLLLTNYLLDTEWHEMMISQLKDEEREEHGR